MPAVATYDLDRLRAHMKTEHRVTVSRTRTRDEVAGVHQLIHEGDSADHEHEDV